MNERNLKKNLICFLKKTSNFKNLQIKYLPLEIFEFHKQFMIGAFLIKTKPVLKESRSTGKIFISFFVTFTMSLFGGGVCFPFNKWIEVNLK